MNAFSADSPSTRSRSALRHTSRTVRPTQRIARRLPGSPPVLELDVTNEDDLAALPELHTKVWNLLKLAGKNKQGVDAQAAADASDDDAETEPDAAPEDTLNRAIWHSVKGFAAPYPEPAR